MDFYYFNAAYVELILTIFWVVVGIILLIINIYKNNILLAVVGVGSLVTSISSHIITVIFNRFPQYPNLKVASLLSLGLIIYFSISRIMKLNQASNPQKIESVEINEINEEASA